MAHQQSKARAAQRTRQIKLKQRQPVTVQKRTSIPGVYSAKPKVPVVQGGIPKGLAALVRKLQIKKKPVRKVEKEK